MLSKNRKAEEEIKLREKAKASSFKQKPKKARL